MKQPTQNDLKLFIIFNKNKLINEISSITIMGGGDVDDGPVSFNKFRDFSDRVTQHTRKAGYTLMNLMMNADEQNTDYRSHPGENASYFQTGIKTDDELEDDRKPLNQRKGYDLWKLYIDKIVKSLGWTYYDDITAEISDKAENLIVNETIDKLYVTYNDKMFIARNEKEKQKPISAMQLIKENKRFEIPLLKIQMKLDKKSNKDLNTEFKYGNKFVEYGIN